MKNVSMKAGQCVCVCVCVCGCVCVCVVCVCCVCVCLHVCVCTCVLALLVLLTVRLPKIQHQYFRLVVSDLLARYTQRDMGGKVVINSLVSDQVKIGDGSLLINCNLKVVIAVPPFLVFDGLILLQTPIAVGRECFLLGLDQTFFNAQVTISYALR